MARETPDGEWLKSELEYQVTSRYPVSDRTLSEYFSTLAKQKRIVFNHSNYRIETWPQGIQHRPKTSTGSAQTITPSAEDKSPTQESVQSAKPQ